MDSGAELQSWFEHAEGFCIWAAVLPNVENIHGDAF